jgi:hypothetical protein
LACNESTTRITVKNINISFTIKFSKKSVIENQKVLLVSLAEKTSESEALAERILVHEDCMSKIISHTTAEFYEKDNKIAELVIN